jgi:hypothetical protein
MENDSEFMPNGYDHVHERMIHINDLLEYCESLLRTQRDVMNSVDSARYGDRELFSLLLGLVRATQAFVKQVEVQYHVYDKEIAEIIHFDRCLQGIASRLEGLHGRISVLEKNIEIFMRELI